MSREYSLNDVIKAFKRIISKSTDDMTVSYYSTIVEYLLLEHEYQEQVNLSGKRILYYFKYSLPVINNDYFEWLYHPYNPVRFAVETFDSIEEIRIELRNRNN